MLKGIISCSYIMVVYLYADYKYDLYQIYFFLYFPLSQLKSLDIISETTQETLETWRKEGKLP